jgi:K+-transporting ATPase c subunit
MKTINPDGIQVNVYWDAAVRGSSFFIPCINVSRAKLQVKRVAKEKELQIKSKTVIEHGIIGLRVWIQ